MSENTQLLILYGGFIGQTFLIPLTALAGTMTVDSVSQAAVDLERFAAGLQVMAGRFRY